MMAAVASGSMAGAGAPSARTRSAPSSSSRASDSTPPSWAGVSMEITVLSRGSAARISRTGSAKRSEVTSSSARVASRMWRTSPSRRSLSTGTLMPPLPAPAR